jgi:hypothetical protein
MILILTAIVILVIVIFFIYYKTNTNLYESGNMIMQLDKKNIMLEKSGIQMSEDYIPSDEKDIITKKYLEDKVPNATSDTAGIIKLSEDLSGTATNPKIADNVIGLKNFANLTQKNCLLGTTNDDNAVSELKIGDQLNTTNNVLNMNKKLIYVMYKYNSTYWYVKSNENINYYTDPSSIQIVSTSTNNVYIDYDTSAESLHNYTIHGGVNDCYIKITYTLPAMATTTSQYNANIYFDDVEYKYIFKTSSSTTPDQGTAPVGIVYVEIKANTTNNISIKVTYASGIPDSSIRVYGDAFISFEEI